MKTIYILNAYHLGWSSWPHWPPGPPGPLRPPFPRIAKKLLSPFLPFQKPHSLLSLVVSTNVQNEEGKELFVQYNLQCDFTLGSDHLNMQCNMYIPIQNYLIQWILIQLQVSFENQITIMAPSIGFKQHTMIAVLQETRNEPQNSIGTK